MELEKAHIFSKQKNDKKLCIIPDGLEKSSDEINKVVLPLPSHGHSHMLKENKGERRI